jgi:hypothetical protein
MIAQEAYLEQRQMLSGVDLKDGAGFGGSLTLGVTHTSNRAHEIVSCPSIIVCGWER